MDRAHFSNTFSDGVTDLSTKCRIVAAHDMVLKIFLHGNNSDNVLFLESTYSVIFLFFACFYIFYIALGREVYCVKIRGLVNSGKLN